MINPDRSPPHSAEAEQGVIGSMLLAPNDVIPEVMDRIGENHFYIPAHRIVFNALIDLWEGGHAIDLITFTQYLRDRNAPHTGNLLDNVGGASFITLAYTFVPTAANANYYVDIVHDKYVLRQMIAVGTKAVMRAHDEQEDVKGLLEEFQSSAVEIGQLARDAEALKHISASVPEVVESIEATYRNRGKPIGLSTGFADLDRMTGGFQKGKKYYFGARPAMGKSSLATEFAEHVAIDSAEKGAAVGIWSIEMTAHELAEVILCRRAQVNLVRLRDGFFSQEQHHAVMEEAKQLKKAPIYIDDTPALSIYEFMARARRAVVKLGVKLIIIDYVQLMKSTSKRALGNREQELTEITQGISATAKSLKIPIIVLAQLNRKNEERGDKTPILSDFRESGSLEQEADLVGLLHRPSYYCQSDVKLEIGAAAEEMSVADFKEFTQLIIAKQRRGPVGTVRLRFIKEYAQFQSEDEDRPLYSNREEDRQQKPGGTRAPDPEPGPPPPPAQGGLDMRVEDQS